MSRFKEIGGTSIPLGQSELSEDCAGDTSSPGSQPLNRPSSLSRLRRLGDPLTKEGAFLLPGHPGFLSGPIFAQETEDERPSRLTFTVNL